MINPTEVVDALSDARDMAKAGDISGATTIVSIVARDIGHDLDVLDKMKAIIRWPDSSPDHGMTKIVMQEVVNEIERLRHSAD